MSGWISSTGWNINLAAPGPIGSTTPSSGSFTSLNSTLLQVAGNQTIKQFISAGNGVVNNFIGYSWNRDLATGALFDNAKNAYDIIMQPSVNYLALEVYAPGGSLVSGNALIVSPTGNIGLGTFTPNPNVQLDIEGPVRAKGYTVATLPTGVTGARAYVTDALTPTSLTTVVGGGAVVVPVFYNGSAWIVG